MARRAGSLVTLTLSIGFFGLGVLAPSPSLQAQAAESSRAQLARRVDALERRADQAEASINRWWWIAGAFVTFAGLAVSTAGVFGYASLKSTVLSMVQTKSDTVIQDKLTAELPRIMEEIARRAEREVLKLARILALNAERAYDAALIEYEWRGSVQALRAELPPLRRAVIDSLYSAEKNRPDNRAKAWEALCELLNENNEIETLRLYLRIAVSSRRYDDALKVYETHRSRILSDRKASHWSVVLLRRSSRLKEAIEVAKRNFDPDDLMSVVETASLQRDHGDFDEVNDLMRPVVNRLVLQPIVRLPDGWNRVLNTFIANCLDRGRPIDAVSATAFLLRGSPGAVELFTAGRVALALPPSDANRAELENAFRQGVLEVGQDGEAAVRCQVLLKQLDGKLAEAAGILRAAIASQAGAAPTGITSEEYYFRCSLGSILIQMNDLTAAIEELIPAAAAQRGGEARFNLAVAYACKGQGAEAALWIKQAADEMPKWAARARDHAVLSGVPEVAEELARRAKRP